MLGSPFGWKIASTIHQNFAFEDLTEPAEMCLSLTKVLIKSFLVVGVPLVVVV